MSSLRPHYYRDRDRASHPQASSINQFEQPFRFDFPPERLLVKAAVFTSCGSFFCQWCFADQATADRFQEELARSNVCYGAKADKEQIKKPKANLGFEDELFCYSRSLAKCLVYVGLHAFGGCQHGFLRQRK